MKHDRKSRVDVLFPSPADAENVEKNKELGPLSRRTLLLGRGCHPGSLNHCVLGAQR